LEIVAGAECTVTTTAGENVIPFPGRKLKWTNTNGNTKNCVDHSACSSSSTCDCDIGYSIHGLICQLDGKYVNA